MHLLTPRSLASATLVLASLLLPQGVSAESIVAGADRLTRSPQPDSRMIGEVLLGELHCVRCHRAEHEAAARIPASTGPALETVGSRVRPEFLRRWLASPHEIKPGTTMPDLLAGLDAGEKAHTVEALTHYLASLRSDHEPVVVAGSVERGRQLYPRIGCVACHAPDPDYPPAETTPGVSAAGVALPSVPLGKLGEKYTITALQRFLLDPLAARPSARMPQVPMTDEEAADLAAYLTGDAPASSPLPIDSALAAEGRRQFAAIGCAACHTAPGIGFSGHAKSLAQLATNGLRGCLAAQPLAGTPHFDLSKSQRDTLLDALAKLAEPLPLTSAQSALRTMAALNCFACHSREKVGGLEPGRAAYFSTVEDVDLGDEGRLPPALSGVGAKLQTAAIERTILGHGAVRPYMAARMPNFGAGHAALLARLFTEADYHPLEKPIPDVGRNTAGRDLMGIKGVACIACHGLNGRKSLGVPAIDLMYAPQRLRREWFHAYLIDPAALRPGTRMPSFWPGGKPATGKGNTQQQIDSLWVYLTELDQSRLPEGLENKGDYELKPTDAPIVFRTFMAKAGMHAIAVGFPQKLHAAFDAKNVRWALAWRGAFLNAEGTWEERAAPLAEPLSEDLVLLPPGVSIAALGDPQTPWPEPSDARFGGYRLDPRGVPTFLYRVGNVDIEDRAEPDSEGRALHRELRLSHGESSCYFRAAVGKKIEAVADGAWRIDGTQTLRILPPAGATVRTSGGQQELLVPVSFDAGGIAIIHTEVTW